MTDFVKSRQVLRGLHREGCCVLPNPWDIGTARYLERLAFKAIATTSGRGIWKREARGVDS